MKSKNPKKNRVKHSSIAPGMTVNFSGVPQTDEATNGEYKTECANIESLVLREYVGRSISLNDFVSLTRSMDIPYASVKTNFDKFVKAALKEGRIVEIPTIMNEKMYVVV